MDKSHLDQIIQSSFISWCNSISRTAGFSQSDYPSASGGGSYLWFTLNRRLKTESDVQMQYGMHLNQVLRAIGEEAGRLGPFVRCEAQLPFGAGVLDNLRGRRVRADLTVFDAHPDHDPLWMAGKDEEDSEAVECLRALIEVKLVPWNKTLEMKDGIRKDLDVFQLIKSRLPSVELYYLILDESIFNKTPAQVARVQSAQSTMNDIRTACLACGVKILSNNPYLLN